MSAAGVATGGAVGEPPHAPEEAACRHCGNRFVPVGDAGDFCCAGCGFVHGLINGSGLEKYYDLRDRATVPVGNAVFQPRDFEWLATEAATAEKSAGAGAAEMEVEVQGIACIGCVWLLDRLFMKAPGALLCDVNPARGTMLWRWKPGALDPAGLARELQSFGYLVGPMSGEAEAPCESHDLSTRIGLCAAFAMNTMLFTLPSYIGLEPGDEFFGVFELLCLLFASLSMVAGGSFFIKRAWAELRCGAVSIDLPIAGGLVVAFAGSLYGWMAGEHSLVYFDFVAIFACLMFVGRWMQEEAVGRNRRQLLSRTRSPAAVSGDDGARVPADSLVPGVGFLVPPGAVVPVNARLVSESADFTLEWINGESEARAWRAGETVPAGAVSAGASSPRLVAIDAWKGSLLERLHESRPAGNRRNPGSERLIRLYVFVVLVLAVAGGAWWLWATGDLLKALPVVVATLVVSCPCAIGVAFPLVEELAVAAARGHGVFVRERSVWGRLPAVKRILFDKTGTLTFEVPRVANAGILSDLDLPERTRLWDLVAMNFHPAARAVQEAMVLQGFAGSAVPSVQVREIVGRGVAIERADGVWTLGAAGWRSEGTGQADLVFSRDGRALATFILVESVRADAAREIGALQREGYRVSILSGDRAGKVRALAGQLGIEPGDAHGAMQPGEKEEWIRKADRGDTLMLGDGANDSLAFDAATCRGTPVIHRGMLGHKADFYYLGRGLAGVRSLLHLARRRRRTLATVLALALAYNAVAITAALAGRVNPLVAAVAMPASSLISIAIAAGGFRGALGRRAGLGASRFLDTSFGGPPWPGIFTPRLTPQPKVAEE